MLGKKGRSAVRRRRGIASGILFCGLWFFLHCGAAGPEAATPWGLLGVALLLLGGALWLSSDDSSREGNSVEDGETSDTGDSHQENR
jgi:hypothetical protein